MPDFLWFSFSAEHATDGQFGLGGEEWPLLHSQETLPGKQEPAGKERESTQTTLWGAPASAKGEKGSKGHRSYYVWEKS